MATSGAEVEFPPDVPVPGEPAPVYEQLRAGCPVARVALPSGDPAWLVTRYADNRRLLADLRFSRAAAAAPGAPRLRRVALEQSSLTTTDPPEHSRLRRLVARAFTTRRVDSLRPRITEIAESLAGRLREAGPPGDLVAGFAQPLPITVICELLGIPATDHDTFRKLSDVYLSATGHSPEQIAQAATELKDYLADLIAFRERTPGTDLLSDLVAARDDDRLTTDELVTLGVTLLVAGYETVANQLAGSVLALVRHPGQLTLLRAKPELLPTAVEELLRHVPVAVSGGTIRVALEDVDLGGVTVRAGEGVLPAITSANRDEEAFPEADRLDLTRTPNPHLAFGHGIHHCLGAPLARAELQIGLGVLLRRFPRLEPAIPLADLPWNTAKLIRGPRALPLAW
nr:FAD-binding monooxygenase [uncultured bacterium]